MMLKPIRWLVLLIMCACCVPAWTADNDPSAGCQPLLLLNHAPCGYLAKWSGGGVSADVQKLRTPDGLIKYQIGAPMYESFCVEAGFGLSPAFYNWIAAFWTPSLLQRQDGSIAVAAVGSTPGSERKFQGAVITETTIPACDAASPHAPGSLTVTFNVDSASDAAPGSVQSPVLSASDGKIWFPHSFRLEIDGLDCTKVAKIDSFTIKRKSKDDAVGPDTSIGTKLGDLVFPNLHITLPEDGAATWRKWSDDFIVNGANGDKDEKNGRLIFLTAASPPSELARIEFKHLGIFRFTPDAVVLNQQVPRNFAADLYCEQMIFMYPGTGGNPAAPPEAAQPAADAQSPTSDGQLGTVYNMGGERPLYFSLNKAEFTTSQVNIGSKCYVPTSNEKLLLLHFTVQNPNERARVVRWDSLRIAAVDAVGANHPCDADWGYSINNSRLDMQMDPGQKAEGYTVITMPAKGPATKLTVRATDTSPLLTYDLREQRVSSLTAPIAEPEDRSGATAREIVPGEFDAAYPYEKFDVAVGRYEYTTSPILGVAPEKGARYLVVALTTKNKTMLDATLRFDTFVPRLTSTKGEPLRYGRNLLVLSADRAFNYNVQAGAETPVRVYFSVPQGSTPETLTLQEGKSRQYTFKIAN